MILATTGTRLGPRIDQSNAFRRFVHRFKPDGFVHGGGRGWDVIAHMEVYTAHPDMPFTVFPATEGGSTWNGIGWPGDTYKHEPLPALERDGLIVEAAHWLIAVPAQDTEELRSGTWATVRYARKLDFPVYIIRADGKIVKDRPL